MGSFTNVDSTEKPVENKRTGDTIRQEMKDAKAKVPAMIDAIYVGLSVKPKPKKVQGVAHKWQMFRDSHELGMALHPTKLRHLIKSIEALNKQMEKLSDLYAEKKQVLSSGEKSKGQLRKLMSNRGKSDLSSEPKEAFDNKQIEHLLGASAQLLTAAKAAQSAGNWTKAYYYTSAALFMTMTALFFVTVASPAAQAGLQITCLLLGSLSAWAGLKPHHELLKSLDDMRDVYNDYQVKNDVVSKALSGTVFSKFTTFFGQFADKAKDQRVDFPYGKSNIAEEPSKVSQFLDAAAAKF